MYNFKYIKKNLEINILIEIATTYIFTSKIFIYFT